MQRTQQCQSEARLKRHHPRKLPPIQKGEVCLALFESEIGFPKDEQKAVFNRCFAITQIPLTVSVEVPYGSYSVSLLHDENQDGELNTNFIGVPQEGIGFF